MIKRIKKDFYICFVLWAEIIGSQFLIIKWPKIINKWGEQMLDYSDSIDIWELLDEN